MNEKQKWISQVLLIADMVDLFLASKPGDKAEGLDEFFEELETDSRYDREAVALVKEIETNLPSTREEMHQEIKKQLGKMTITHEEQNAFLKVLISSIGFRSRATALHCTIIVEVADMLAQYCNVSEEEKKEIHLGAILHDLGKIAIPVRILESNGKLEGEDWEIMKSHIVLTEEILDGIISERIKDIAVRHHETLDGKGYPRGLTEQDLTLPQRILAVADIISALSEERSYKAAFPLDEIVKILEGLCQRGNLAPEVVEVAKLNKDSLHKRVIETGRKAAADYMYISNSLEKSNNV